MTDNEIIKALECCCGGLTSDWCDKCPLNKTKECDKDLLILEKLALDLINRLQAENERLEKENQLMLDNHPANTHRNCVVIDNGVIYTKTIEDYEKFLTDVSTEAYKEFVYDLMQIPHLTVHKKEIKNLLKEKVGETK